MNDLSLLLPTAQTIAVSAYIDFIPHLQYSKPLGSSRFSKTIKCLSPSGSVVAKLIIKPTNHELDMLTPLMQFEKLKKDVENVPNVLPFNEIIDSDRACYLIRDFIGYDLYSRLSIRPFLEPIEKKWIVYQLLNALSKLHERNICHGDIKLENVLLTSWTWALLTDFAHLKPVYLPDYNQSQFSFYFDTNNRHSCYIAPERFKSQEELAQLNTEDCVLLPEMDIFSLGCIISELYTDGIPLFSLSQIFKYKKGEYTPNLDSIGDSNIKKLIKSMIDLNPSNRLSARDCLSVFRKLVFPDHFYTFLHSYIRSITLDKNFTNEHDKKNNTIDKFNICNLRLDKLWTDFDKISLYLGFKGTIIEFDSRDNKTDQNSIIPIELNLPGMRRHIPQSTSNIFTETSNNDCSSLILLSLVMYNVRNTTHSAYRSQACDLILAFAEQLHDEAKLDRCLPYLANMLDDPNEELQATALKSLTQLLLMIDTITPINSYLFPEYLLPKLNLLLKRSYSDFSKESKSTNPNSTNSNSKLFIDSSTSTIIDNAKSDFFSKGAYIRMVFANCLPHLALTAKTFYYLSKSLSTNNISSSENDLLDNVNKKNFFDIDYQELEDHFEQLTIQILTDSDSHVKISLMKNIIPLCSFFGKDKINDIILSHLITYLNDKDPQIKLVFIQCILPLSVFIGPTSIEQYILPLLMQTLYNPNELIVIELINTLKSFIDIGMIRKTYYWDLIDLTINLCLHPNELIRESVINLMLSIGKQLSLADLYCVMYPLIRPYFQHEIGDFNWDNLYLTVHEPLSRTVFDIAKNWSFTREQTLFWQRVNSNRGLDSFGNAKLMFMKKQRGSATSALSAATSDVISNSEIPLNKEDKNQVNRLISIGFNESHLWKIATLRSYIYKVVRLEGRTLKFLANEESKHNLMTRSVFVDVKFSFENINLALTNRKPIKNLTASTNESISISTNKDDNIISHNNTNNLILGNLKQTRPFVSESKTTAIGETSSMFSGLSRGPLFDDVGDANVYDETLNQKKLITEIHHSYPGYNPFILKYLNSISFVPDLDIYAEFGMKITTLTLKNDEPAVSESKLIGHLHEHNGSINCIAISPDQRFFITGDDDGSLKIWESARLELDVTGQSCLSANLGSCIKMITFMPNRNCFAVCTVDGLVKIFRVNFIDSLNKKKSDKYKETSISMIRKFKLKKVDMFVTNMKFSILRERPYLFLTTISAKIMIIDIRTMKEIRSFQNNVIHGVPLCFTTDKEQNWLLIGTSKGILNLWDIVTGLCVKSVKFKATSYPITNITILPSISSLNSVKDQFVSFIGGTGESDVIIWDVCRMLPRKVLCSSTVNTASTMELYSIKEVNEEIELDLFDNWYESEHLNKSSTALCLSVSNKLINSTYDKKIIEWDLNSIDKSHCVVESSDHDENTKALYAETQINSTLALVHERYVQNTVSRPQSKQQNSVSQYFGIDKVNVLAVLMYPFKMIICGDRNGLIRIYK